MYSITKESHCQICGKKSAACKTVNVIVKNVNFLVYFSPCNNRYINLQKIHKIYKEKTIKINN